MGEGEGEGEGTWSQGLGWPRRVESLPWLTPSTSAANLVQRILLSLR